MITHTLRYDAPVDATIVTDLLSYLVGPNPRVKRDADGAEYLPGVSFGASMSRGNGFSHNGCAPSPKMLRENLPFWKDTITGCDMETGGMLGSTTRVDIDNDGAGCDVEIVSSRSRAEAVRMWLDGRLGASDASRCSQYEGPIGTRINLTYGGIDTAARMQDRAERLSSLSAVLFGEKTYAAERMQAMHRRITDGQGARAINRYVGLKEGDGEVKIDGWAWVHRSWNLPDHDQYDAYTLTAHFHPDEPMPEQYCFDAQTWDCGLAIDIYLRGRKTAVARSLDTTLDFLGTPYRVEMPGPIEASGLFRLNEGVMDQTNVAGFLLVKGALQRRGVRMHLLSEGPHGGRRMTYDGKTVSSWTPQR